MIFKELFTELKTKLETITDIKNIEWYLDQDLKKGGIVVTPTVLIKFEPSNTVQLNKKSQSIKVNFTIMLYTGFNKSNHKLTTDALHFNLEQTIFAKLVKYEQTNITPIVKDNGLLLSTQTYVIKLVRPLPLPNLSTLPPQTLTPNINGGLN